MSDEAWLSFKAPEMERLIGFGIYPWLRGRWLLTIKYEM
jgi:hypothetical protein